MKFKKGQQVLCVNASYGTYCAFPLKKGSIYSVDDFYECPCGSHQITLMEVPGLAKMGCRCDHSTFRRQSYFKWRFIPLEYFEKFIEYSEEAEVQKEELYEDVILLPSPN
jgi:hypothetical protein